MPQPETVFRYPSWLVVGAPAFAVLVTTLAGSAAGPAGGAGRAGHRPAERVTREAASGAPIISS